MVTRWNSSHSDPGRNVVVWKAPWPDFVKFIPAISDEVQNHIWCKIEQVRDSLVLKIAQLACIVPSRLSPFPLSLEERPVAEYIHTTPQQKHGHPLKLIVNRAAK